MRRATLASFLLWLTASCLAQNGCPRHIETPIYPPVAHIARAQGEVTLKVTIDAEGNVQRAEVADDLANRHNSILEKAAIENMQKWTFAKPAAAPVTQVIVYEYKMDSSLPPIDKYQGPITKVVFDLPGRVTILANESVAQPHRGGRNNTWDTFSYR